MSDPDVRETLEQLQTEIEKTQAAAEKQDTLDEIKEVIKNKASDYIGLGPIFKTDTKKETEPELGISGLQEVILGLNKLNISSINAPKIAGVLIFAPDAEIYPP